MTIIKKILLDRGLSQNRLSQEARVPTSSISLIVNGKMIPCRAWRQRIAEVMQVPESILFPSLTLSDQIQQKENVK